MKKLISLPLIFATLLIHSVAGHTEATSNTTPLSNSSSVDWTPLFKDWEDGCSFGDEYQNFVNKLFYFKSDGAPLTGFVVLPAIYTGSFNPQILREDHPKYDDGAYTNFSFKVLNGAYYGIPVSEIGYYIGNSHGLSGGYLELTPTDAQLREFLEKVQFKSTEIVMYEAYAKGGEFEEVMFDNKAVVNVEKDKITIVCDVST